ncbi:MAG: hypothetical protein KGI04_02095 [Candidatus Micrarchaeota archaeon]|nr:hypothetical protein [Candidatus Micrarchaeota archaeon]
MGNVIKRNAAQGGFLLVKPKELSDVERIARAIARCKGVKKVFVSSGEYGFIATIDDGETLAEIGCKVRKITPSRVKIARNHFVYKNSDSYG